MMLRYRQLRTIRTNAPRRRPEGSLSDPADEGTENLPGAKDSAAAYPLRQEARFDPTRHMRSPCLELGR